MRYAAHPYGCARKAESRFDVPIQKDLLNVVRHYLAVRQRRAEPMPESLKFHAFGWLNPASFAAVSTRTLRRIPACGAVSSGSEITAPRYFLASVCLGLATPPRLFQDG